MDFESRNTDTKQSSLSAIILAVLITLPVSYYRGTCSELPPFSVGGGISYALISPGTMDDFWKPGANIKFGMRLPFSISHDHNQFWLDFGYNYYPFDHGSTFPIKSFSDSPEVKLSGRATQIVSATIFAKFTFVDEHKRVVPYFTIGSGFIGRSRTILNSDSILLPHSETAYKGAGLFCFGVGTDIRISNDLRLYWDWKYIVGNTKPGKTSIAPLNIGVLTKLPDF